MSANANLDVSCRQIGRGKIAMFSLFDVSLRAVSYLVVCNAKEVYFARILVYLSTVEPHLIEIVYI